MEGSSIPITIDAEVAGVPNWVVYWPGLDSGTYDARATEFGSGVPFGGNTRLWVTHASCVKIQGRLMTTSSRYSWCCASVNLVSEIGRSAARINENVTVSSVSDMFCGTMESQPTLEFHSIHIPFHVVDQVSRNGVGNRDSRMKVWILDLAWHMKIQKMHYR